jgi:hypothetical protein
MRKFFSIFLVLAMSMLMLGSLAGTASAAVAECFDGVDNDRDGLVDFPADPQCDSRSDDSEVGSPGLKECFDGIDNDRDGLVDFPADPGCTSRYDDTEATPPSPGGGQERLAGLR